ncbi:hypothetical protein [Inediibacterium massiliense]|uniref:hypothetical protein n=1 Tax=Inediibacterium massiliense TaxID=1658111 RepID=UPI0006B461B7|nr:hypothetical protein [Inediibacterium massiliense]
MSEIIEEGKKLDVKCTYAVNKYLRNYEQQSKQNNMYKSGDEYITIQEMGGLKGKDFCRRNFKEVVSDPKFIDYLKELVSESLTLYIILKNLEIKKQQKYSCSYDGDNIIFMDEDDNQVIFSNEEKYEVKNIEVVKKIKNKLNYPTLGEYIEQLKNSEVMRKFKHGIDYNNGVRIDLYFGNEVKVCNYEEQQIELEEDDLNKQIDYIYLECKY